MLDFSKIATKESTIQDLAVGLTVQDLRDLTNEMIDTQLSLIQDADDAAVLFVPEDPLANDTFAASTDLVNLPWTLGHVIVHVTASSEEAAFIAAEMARGVIREGRSRFEIPWETVTTIAQCRARLEESRRMRLASLEIWPDEPFLDTVVEGRWGRIDPVVRFIFGLKHDADHLGQIADIVQQAQAARFVSAD